VRAAGAVVAPLLILAFALLVVRAPLAWLTVDRWGVDAVWWSFTISAIVAMTLTVGYYLGGSWRSARMSVAPGA
jgi:Na+-driven multidrug efflux pump